MVCDDGRVREGREERSEMMMMMKTGGDGGRRRGVGVGEGADGGGWEEGQEQTSGLLTKDRPAKAPSWEMRARLPGPHSRKK